MLIEVVLVIGWIVFCVLASMALGMWYRRQDRLDVRSPHLSAAPEAREDPGHNPLRS